MTKQPYPRLVHWFYSDGRGLLSNKSTREQLTKVYITDKKGEDLLKGGKVACLTSSGLFGTVNDPYFKLERKEGYTTKAKRHGDLRRNIQKTHPNMEKNLTGISSKIMDYGEYVYLNITFLENKVNSFFKMEENESAFFSKNFVYKEAFTAALLEKLIEYRPRDLFHNAVIEKYHREELPALFAEIKIKYPDLYNEVLKTSDWLKEQDKDLTYVGKKAKVHSLNPGPVKVQISFLDNPIFEWDGKTLTHQKKLDSGEMLTQSITPSNDMIVAICNDNVIGEQTELVD